MTLLRYLIVLYCLGLSTMAFAQKNKTPQPVPAPYKQVSSDVKYRILKSNKKKPNNITDNGSVIVTNYRIVLWPKDSILFDNKGYQTPAKIPVIEPNLGPVLRKLHKKDSVEIIITADAYFRKTLNKLTPPEVNPEDSIKFTLKVLDIISSEQIQRQQQENLKQLRKNDSIDRVKYLSTLTDVQQTPEGVYYIKLKNGRGPLAKKNDKLSVYYKSMFLDGDVFDRSETSPFVFLLGHAQLIPGWESILINMREGDKVRAIVPWNLAYGEKGMGLIKPMSTLVFEIELLKVE